MALTRASIVYNSKSRYMDVYNSGGAIIQEMLNQSNSICPLIDNGTIKIDTIIGSGQQGKVYRITIDDEVKSYVVKKSPATIKEYAVKVKSEKIAFLEKVSKNFDIPLDLLENVNAALPDVLTPGTIVLLPTFAKECVTTKELSFDYVNRSGDKVIIPRGSFYCTDAMTEYLISLFLGEVRRREESVFFIDIFSFATCQAQDSNRFFHFTFMEQIDGSFHELLSVLEDNDINAMIIHILIGIAKMQEYGIQHNDLHLSNVFYKRNDQSISPREYKFQMGDVTITTPDPGYTIKIADFGYAQKFSPPGIYNRSIQNGEYGPIIPNYKNDAFDPLLVLIQATEAGNELAEGLLARCVFRKDELSMEDFESIISTSPAGVRRPMHDNPLLQGINALTFLSNLPREYYQ